METPGQFWVKINTVAADENDAEHWEEHDGEENERAALLGLSRRYIGAGHAQALPGTGMPLF